MRNDLSSRLLNEIERKNKFEKKKLKNFSKFFSLFGKLHIFDENKRVLKK